MPPITRPYEKAPRRNISSAAWWMDVLGLLCLIAILIGMGWLRETPLFWRNEGGWPVWLRDVVRWTFWPLLLCVVLRLAWRTLRTLLRPGPNPRHLLVQIPVLMALWLLLGGVTGFVLANNMVNVLEGRPMHFKP